MKKSVLFLIIPIVLLSGCSVICPDVKFPINRDLTAFENAFSHFQKTNSIARLQQFADTFPESPWAPRAETIMLYVKELDQRKKELQDIRSALAEQKDSNASLARENKQLTEAIEQLKGSLIELEQRPQ